MTTRLSVVKCQQWLVVAWSIGAALTFVIVLLQTLSQDSALPPEEAWAWFTSRVLPTLTLMWGALFSETRSPARATSTVDRFSFNVSIGLSIFYLVLLILTLLLPIPMQMRESERASLLTRSALWLGIVQGLVGVALGAFFVSRRTA